MKILHLCIGRAPFYTGGSVKYAEALMKQQVLDGDTVALLFPGHTSLFTSTKIITTSSSDAIQEFEIVNPLPVSLMSGIRDPRRYTENKHSLAYETFLREFAPDVIHVHSIMGIHLSFFETAKALHLPMIFTTHDYFPICVRCTLVDSTHHLCTQHTPAKCAACNLNSGLPPHWEMFIRSKTYRKIKHAPLTKQLRFWARSKIKNTNKSTPSTQSLRNSPLDVSLGMNPTHDPRLMMKVHEYELLLNQFSQIMACFTLVHCNSELSQSVYAAYFPQLNTITKAITHEAMPQGGQVRTHFDHEFRVGYLGGISLEKGIYTLLEAFKTLPSQDLRYKLILWGDDYSSFSNAHPNIENKGNFTPDQYGTVFSSMDVLIVPSLWYETFGFVVLEALSYGIPVLCSDRVGAKMVLKGLETSLIYPAEDTRQLSSMIQNLSNPTIYKDIVEKIGKMDRDFSFTRHAEAIKRLYDTQISQ